MATSLTQLQTLEQLSEKLEKFKETTDNLSESTPFLSLVVSETVESMFQHPVGSSTIVNLGKVCNLGCFLKEVSSFEHDEPTTKLMLEQAGLKTSEAKFVAKDLVGLSFRQRQTLAESVPEGLPRVLTEAEKMDLADMIEKFRAARSVIDSIPSGFEKTKQALKEFQLLIQKVSGQGKVKGFFADVGLGTSAKNLSTQIASVLGILDNLKNLGNDMRDTYDTQLEELETNTDKNSKEYVEAENALRSNLKGTIVNQLGKSNAWDSVARRFGGGASYPKGLTPEDFADEFVAVLGLTPQPTIGARVKGAVSGFRSPGRVTEGVTEFNSALDHFKTYVPPTSVPAPSVPTSSTNQQPTSGQTPSLVNSDGNDDKPIDVEKLGPGAAVGKAFKEMEFNIKNRIPNTVKDVKELIVALQALITETKRTINRSKLLKEAYDEEWTAEEWLKNNHVPNTPEELAKTFELFADKLHKNEVPTGDDLDKVNLFLIALRGYDAMKTRSSSVPPVRLTQPKELNVGAVGTAPTRAIPKPGSNDPLTRKLALERLQKALHPVH